LQIVGEAVFADWMQACLLGVCLTVLITAGIFVIRQWIYIESSLHGHLQILHHVIFHDFFVPSSCWEFSGDGWWARVAA